MGMVSILHNWGQNLSLHTKRSFGSAHAVVECLGCYTHKITISNHRIRAIDADTITFSYKDYKQKAVKKEITLTHAEFIRRFGMHILPKGFYF
jgi:hypothetical protein